jgi:hypothetical protein
MIGRAILSDTATARNSTASELLDRLAARFVQAVGHDPEAGQNPPKHDMEGGPDVTGEPRGRPGCR